MMTREYVRKLPLAILLGLVVAVPVYAIQSLVIPIGMAVEKGGSTWSEFLGGEFAAWVSSSFKELPRALAPWWFQDASILLLAGVAVVVFVYWRRGPETPSNPKENLQRRLLALAPVLVGMLFSIRYTDDTLAALAEAGLSDPSFVGAGVAESLGPTIVGAIMSLVLLALYGRSSATRQPATRESET